MATTSYSDVAQILRRAGYGPTDAEIRRYQNFDVAAIVEQLLDFTNSPPATEPAWVRDAAVTDSNKTLLFTHWWLNRMRTTTSPLQEKMVYFWHNHFATAHSKLGDTAVMWDQQQLFRGNALGNFRDLTIAVALHPAIQVYLDNQTNVLGRPNENFARELMELFVVGAGNYTQDDVVAAARAWTGYGIVGRVGLVTDYTAKFAAAKHDNGSKTFLGTTKNWDGPGIINELLLTNATTKMASAKLIARKAWSWFAYPNPDQAIIDAIAATFFASDLSLTVLMRAIFTHPQFLSPQAKQGLAKTPIEFVVGVMRATGIDSADAHPERFLKAMGMLPFEPPNVSGWSQNSYWVSATAFYGRADFLAGVGTIVHANTAPNAKPLPNVVTQTAQQAVNDAFNTFGVVDPTPQTRASLEGWLTTQKLAKTESYVERQFLIKLVCLSPEYQMA